MAAWLIPVIVAVLYAAGLFWIAHAGERPLVARLADRNARLIFGLSLAVYCTSWTFYGAVGTAVDSGWQFLPIYLGPILLFVFLRPLVSRVLQMGKAQHSTSIADFLSARYGKSAWVAALVTLIALFGSLPYMALQLKSVSQTLITLAPGLGSYLGNDDVALAVAASMAGFAVIFGTGRLDLTQHNRGLVLAIALEAVVKLAALLAVAAFAMMLIWGNVPAARVADIAAGSFTAQQFDLRFAVLTMLAAMAALCLPRQFHMLVVEAREDRLAGPMWWLFPAYLLLICLGVVPVMIAGQALLPAGSDADMMMLQLPLAFDAQALAIFAFIGGFSAATGMIIVASVALSGMITNDLIVPALFRSQMRRGGPRQPLGPRLIAVRRGAVVGLLALAYVYYRAIGNDRTLAGLGEIAFAAAAQLAPGLLLGLYWRKANRAGMIAGLLGGFTAWLVLLGLPMFGPAIGSEAALLVIGPDPLVSGVIISLAVNLALLVLFSLASEPNLQDRVQAVAFIDRGRADLGQAAFATQTRVMDFRLLMEQLTGETRARDAMNRLRLESGRRYKDADPVDPDLLATSEQQIASVIGSSSSRALIQSTLDGDPVTLERVVAMFDETSQRLQFGAGLLQIAIENIDQGISVVDEQQRLVAWNSRYVEMFDLPPDLVEVGRPIADLLRFNLLSLGTPDTIIEREVAKRIDHLRRGTRHSTERGLADGRVLLVLGNPAPNGGYVTSYSDVTADRQAEQALEAKVVQRTGELQKANAALEAATRSKTRFLAAASHDLVQPMNAARLFASALAEDIAPDRPDQHQLLSQIDRSIGTADRLLRALLDISRLDGGKAEVDKRRFPLDQAIAEVVNEFEMQASAKGLLLSQRPSGLWVETDRGLLISVLQNLVTNAVRYTDRGRILVAARKRGTAAEVIVADQGRGIAPADAQRIFEEFTRLPGSREEEGLGLGLAIVRRIAALLGTEVELSSTEGRGSLFRFRLPLTHPGADAADDPHADDPHADDPHADDPHMAARAARAAAASERSRQAQIVCMDDDVASLQGITALLVRWGHEVQAAANPASIQNGARPDLLILDYRLADGMTGEDAHAMLRARWGHPPPTILLTAEDNAETEAAAARMGAIRLIKPPAPAALRALIDAMLG